MNKILSLDSPFVQFMEKVADFIIANFLTIICSLPIFTIGAAAAAHHKVIQDIVWDNEKPIFKSYFKAFSETFKNATVVWLLTVLAGAVLVGSILLVYINFSGDLALLLYILVGAAGVAVLGSAAFAFPLMVRYENSLKQYIRNAFILALANLPRTVAMLAIYAIPVLMAVLFTEVFFNMLIVWALIGISVVVCFETLLVRPVFRKLEQIPPATEDVADE